MFLRDILKIKYIHVRSYQIHLNVFFLHIYFFTNFYGAYLEILILENYFENCAKSKWKEQKRTRVLKLVKIGKITQNDLTFS